MAGGGIAGAGGVFEQFAIWGVLMQLASAILAPPMLAVQQSMFNKFQTATLPPDQLADLVLKNWLSQELAEGLATKWGINSELFALMVDDAGEPIALDALLEAFRRGFIPWSGSTPAENSVEGGVQTSRVRDQWLPVIRQLAEIVIPVGDIVSAAVKGQIDIPTAQQIAGFSGLSGDDFTILYNTAGNPPGPGELVDFARRGFIPVDGTGPDALSLHQGIIEGLTKNKWWPILEQSMVYLPPPRTVTALERAGSITPGQAQALYQQHGLDAQLAAAYSADASAVKLVKTKEIAEGQVIDLFKAQIITEAEAETMLGDLGYTSAEALLMLEYAQLAEELKALNAAVAKVGSLYVARKIGPNTASQALTVLGLAAPVVTNLLATWGLERGATVKLLTAAEIGDAVKYAIMDQATGQAALEALGYTAYDAWVRLSLSQDGPLPNPPALPAEPAGMLP